MFQRGDIEFLMKSILSVWQKRKKKDLFCTIILESNIESTEQKKIAILDSEVSV